MFDFVFDFGAFWVPFWLHFGTPNRSFWGSIFGLFLDVAPRGAQERQKRRQAAPTGASGANLGAKSGGRRGPGGGCESHHEAKCWFSASGMQIFEKVEKIRGLDITIVIKSRSVNDSLELLKKFNFPFIESKGN